MNMTPGPDACEYADYASPSCGLVRVGLASASASSLSWPSALASLPSTTSLMRCIVLPRLLRRLDGLVLVVPMDDCRACPRRHGVPPGEVGGPPVGVMGVPAAGGEAGMLTEVGEPTIP